MFFNMAFGLRCVSVYNCGMVRLSAEFAYGYLWRMEKG